MYGIAPRRLCEQEIYGRLGRLHVHELRLAFRRRDFVFTELIAVGAGEIALVGQVQDHRLKGKVSRRIGQRLAYSVARNDDMRVIELFQ